MSPQAGTVVSIVEALLQAIAAAPAIIDEIQQSVEVSPDVKTLLDKIDTRISEHEKREDEMRPLPVPDATPKEPHA